MDNNMTDRPKVKLCWNCEGRLDLNEENCPFCGVYVSPIEGGDAADPVAPPYRIEEERESTEEAPPAPYSPEQFAEEERPQAAAKTMDGETLQKQAAIEGASLVLTPMTLLIGGSFFFFFSLVLLLFSQEGVFTLKWNASHWYLYLLTGLLMLFFGWKTLRRIEE